MSSGGGSWGSIYPASLVAIGATQVSSNVPDMTNALTRSMNPFASSGCWTREQLKLAFHFYCQTPFGKLHGRNPDVIELAALLGRTASALAMKLVNFASLDPSITGTGRKGLSGASARDREIWDEFHSDWERLTVEAEQIRQHLSRDRGANVEPSREIDDEFVLSDYTGETRQAIVQQRMKQNFFRRAVLASYRGRCCISGVSDARLLVASHIVPWREDKANRLNPSNGLCLSAIHDKAFDSGLIALSDDFRVLVSTELLDRNDAFVDTVFAPIMGQQIEIPERFVPDKVLIRRHRLSHFKAG